MTGLLESARRVLHDVFGYGAFRPGQEEVLGALFAGEDVLAVMPTGSGKSLCYQLPALVRSGLALVVSPLISLMRDQVEQLRGYGIEAAALNSANDGAEATRILRALRARELRLLYVAPERLARPDTVALLRETGGVSLLAIDEAHCVSQWGHDFRPEYLQLRAARDALGGVQTIALTATADAPTRTDIVTRLFPAPPRVFVRSFDRPNLRLAMQTKSGTGRQVADFVAAHRGASGVIYCSSRKRTEALAAALAEGGVRALPYHAGMEPGLRAANQAAFQQEDGVVMVATVAFGMGIDKPDVRFVCQADLPQNIEEYYQQIGRAGRDGLPADTLTLYGMDDIRLRRMQIEEGEAPEERKRIERQRFNALLSLCEAPRCRRQTLLGYFGETLPDPCGNCDLCIEGVELFDGTIDAQKAMSAVLRTGERFGTEHLISILTGNATEAVQRWGHDRLPTFGVGMERSANDWRAIFRQLHAAGLLSLDIVEYGRWTVTDRGRRVLRGEERIELRRDALARASRRTRKAAAASSAQAATAGADPELLAALKTLRGEIARAAGQPAYVVFPDRTLIEIAAARPATLEALRELHGVGERKLARYGAAFLEVVRRFGAAQC